MIRAILTSGSMRSLRHKSDRSCATKLGHISCHRQWMDWLLRSPDLGSTIVPVNDAWHGGPRMLVLGVARFRPGVQHQHEEHRAAFNAHLMQPLNPRIRLAGPMFEPSGTPSGVFML